MILTLSQFSNLTTINISNRYKETIKEFHNIIVMNQAVKLLPSPLIAKVGCGDGARLAPSVAHPFCQMMSVMGLRAHYKIVYLHQIILHQLLIITHLMYLQSRYHLTPSLSVIVNTFDCIHLLSITIIFFRWRGSSLNFFSLR